MPIYIMKKKAKKLEIKLKKDDEIKVYAFLGAFLTIVGFLLVFILRRKDKYAMFYAKQGLVLFLAALVFGAISNIPIIGWIFTSVLIILWCILWIVTWINSLSGHMIKTIIIGELANKIPINL